jgi:hypothetical protein
MQNDTLNFRTSTYSFANGNCVETASGGGTVLVRDTADREGTVLPFACDAWRAFTATVAGRPR